MSDRSIFLFDACAVVAVLLGETGGAAAAKLLSDGNDCRVTAVIVSEAAYVLLRVGADAAHLDGTSTHVIANSAGVIWSPPIPSESSRMPTAN
jgi:uncharacterized protein with PIN domain